MKLFNRKYKHKSNWTIHLPSNFEIHPHFLIVIDFQFNIFYYFHPSHSFSTKLPHCLPRGFICGVQYTKLRWLSNINPLHLYNTQTIYTDRVLSIHTWTFLYISYTSVCLISIYYVWYIYRNIYMESVLNLFY